MGERKATNKYYPPDFDPKKHRSLDAYHGSHALRERAKKIHEGILVIRFEMPYNIWCEGCNNHIGMGVRYNAEKSKVGMYYSTPIYKFRMKCHLCDNYFEIKTDPANHDYVIIIGARRKEQRWDPKENEQIVPEDKATQKKLALDAMYKLEHGHEDELKSRLCVRSLGHLERARSSRSDDYSLNKMLRQQFRTEKKAIKLAAQEDDEILKRCSLDITLVAEHPEDVRIAHLLSKYRTVQSFDARQKEKRDEICSRPIFQPPTRPQKAATITTATTAAFESSGIPQAKSADCYGVVRRSGGQGTGRGLDSAHPGSSAASTVDAEHDRAAVQSSDGSRQGDRPVAPGDTRTQLCSYSSSSSADDE